MATTNEYQEKCCTACLRTSPYDGLVPGAGGAAVMATVVVMADDQDSLPGSPSLPPCMLTAANQWRPGGVAICRARYSS